MRSKKSGVCILRAHAYVSILAAFKSFLWVRLGAEPGKMSTAKDETSLGCLLLCAFFFFCLSLSSHAVYLFFFFLKESSRTAGKVVSELQLEGMGRF